MGVSPSFVSQLENGKSQPSVATLYSLSQLLRVSIDELFAGAATEGASVPLDAVPTAVGESRPVETELRALNRSDFGSPLDAFPRDAGTARVSVTRPGERARLEMDTGVVWKRLANNTGTDLDFIEMIYPPHSSSTNDNRMLQHAGTEYGYLLEGELEVTIGFNVFTLHAGESLGFDSSQPHLFRNLGDTQARGIWFVRHPHP